MNYPRLTSSGGGLEIRTEDGNMVATTDNRLVERSTREKQEFVRELVGRWNAYPIHEKRIDTLEGEIQDLKDEAIDEDQREVLDAIEMVRGEGSAAVVKYLRIAAQAIADDYGLTSIECHSIERIINAIET